MNSTPRTESHLIDNADLTDQGIGKSNYVSADFARELEMEIGDKKGTCKWNNWAWGSNGSVAECTGEFTLPFGTLEFFIFCPFCGRKIEKKNA